MSIKTSNFRTDFTSMAERPGFRQNLVEQGQRIPFDGDPSVIFPTIGSVYLVKDYEDKGNGSTARPMILIGYYTHKGKAVALEFLKPTSQLRETRSYYDTDRYDIFLPYHAFSNFRPVDKKIKCDSTLTLPNNKNIIVRPLPIDAVCDKLLADYLLRRALVLYEQKTFWKKDAAIPDGSIRHGFLFDGIDKSQCVFEDKLIPDLSNGKHNFSQKETGPPYIIRNMSKILEWAQRTVDIKRMAKVSINLPELKTFPNWPIPADFVKSRPSVGNAPTHN